jgi:hypothetical protein
MVKSMIVKQLIMQYLEDHAQRMNNIFSTIPNSRKHFAVLFA